LPRNIKKDQIKSSFMRFIIKNFGPIEKADVTLKNLNIFIGKNSSGKSYLAYLIWALLSVEPDWEKLIDLFNRFVPNSLINSAISKFEALRKGFQEREKEFDLKRYVDELSKIDEELSNRFKSLIIEAYKKFDEIWGRNLEELLKNAFLVDKVYKLVKAGYEEAEITVSNDNGDKRIHIRINKNGLTSWVDKAVLEDLKRNLFVSVISGKPMLVSLDYYGENSKELTHSESFIKNTQAIGIVPASFMFVFDYYAPFSQTFIAPDGRTGLIRSIEAYKYALISRRVTINEVDRIFMRDFDALYPKVKNEKISSFANFIEERLGIKYILGREQPRFTVQVKDVEIPLQRAPSGYRELAPIVYVMKYALNDGSIIFIEEPEAHLHPDAQVIITRALAGLSQYCYVVITTHSITVLDEISNLLKLSKLPSDVKRNLGYEEWEGLNPENIGVFLFSDGKVEELKIYEDGIEESDLDRVVIEISNLHAMVEEEYEYSRRMQTQR